MRAGMSSRGYTIVEVMIFLAVSGFMFIIAAAFISGKQSKAEFRQGMNDVTSQIQQVVNNVSNGLYPSNGNFTCKAGPTLAAGFAGQGSNQECMFLGQVIQFGIHGTGGIGYDVYTVVGNRCAAPSSPCTTDNLSTSFADARPTAVYQPVDMTDQKTLQWGLQVTAMYNASTWTPTGAVGFFGSFGSYSGGTLNSGSQTVVVTNVPGSALNQTEDQMAKSGGIINNIRDTSVNNRPNYVICFKNGNQRGSVTIGGGAGQRMTVNEQLGRSVVWVCP